MNPYDNPPKPDFLYQDLQEPLRTAAIATHYALHKVWTNHVGHIGYVKADFIALEKAIDGIIAASRPDALFEKIKTCKLKLTIDGQPIPEIEFPLTLSFSTGEGGK